MKQPAFFVGTGHSLEPGHLTVLKENNAFSVSCNQIHHIYPETAWRPDVWVLYSGKSIEHLPKHFKEDYWVVIRSDVGRGYEEYFAEEDNLWLVADCCTMRADHAGQWCAGNPFCFSQATAEPMGVAAQIAWKLGYGDIYLLGNEMTGPHFYDRYIFPKGIVGGQGDLKKAYAELCRQAKLRGHEIINLSGEEDIDWNSIFNR